MNKVITDDEGRGRRYERIRRVRIKTKWNKEHRCGNSRHALPWAMEVERTKKKQTTIKQRQDADLVIDTKQPTKKPANAYDINKTKWEKCNHPYVRVFGPTKLHHTSICSSSCLIQSQANSPRMEVLAILKSHETPSLFSKICFLEHREGERPGGSVEV